MKKYKSIIIFIISFIALVIIDLFFFSYGLSQIEIRYASGFLDDFFLGILVFFWLFIGVPALGAYLISFKLLKKKNGNSIEENKLEKNSKKSAVILTIILGILVTIFIRLATQPRFLPYTFHSIEQGELKENNSELLPTNTPTIIFNEENIPVSTLIPTPTQLPLFPLHFGTIDYSRAEPKGDVPGAIVKLYDSQGRFIGEQIVPPIVFNNNIGSGGNVEFKVPLGTYKAEAKTDNRFGISTVTINSFDDQQYYSIYMYAKDITISGKYFFDANKNGQYDNGEQSFANKKINSFVRTAPGRLYTANSTVSDSSGNYSLKVNYVGSYTLGAEQVLGYQELPARWVDLNGGESITYDIYLWPN